MDLLLSIICLFVGGVVVGLSLLHILHGFLIMVGEAFKGLVQSLRFIR